MTEEEVELIYNYLHETYDYIEGDLIRKLNCNKSGTPKGFKLGSFSAKDGVVYLKGLISANGIKIQKPLSHIIYFYHFKSWPSFVIYKDMNPMNCKIENLQPVSRSQMENLKPLKKGYQERCTNNGIRYGVGITTKKNNVRGKIYLGTYDTKEEAQEIYKCAKNIYLENDCPKNLKRKLLEIYPHIRIKNHDNNKLPGAYKQRGGYKSSIQINKKTIYLGSFKTEEEAHAAYLKAKEEYK